MRVLYGIVKPLWGGYSVLESPLIMLNTNKRAHILREMYAAGDTAPIAAMIRKIFQFILPALYYIIVNKRFFKVYLSMWDKSRWRKIVTFYLYLFVFNKKWENILLALLDLAN